MEPPEKGQIKDERKKGKKVNRIRVEKHTLVLSSCFFFGLELVFSWLAVIFILKQITVYIYFFSQGQDFKIVKLYLNRSAVPMHSFAVHIITSSNREWVQKQHNNIKNRSSQARRIHQIKYLKIVLHFLGGIKTNLNLTSSNQFVFITPSNCSTLICKQRYGISFSSSLVEK